MTQELTAVPRPCAEKVNYQLLVAEESAGMRVVVVSSIDPRAAPYEADLDSVSGVLASLTAAAAVESSPAVATDAASQLGELAMLSPHSRAIVQVHHTHGSDIPTPIRSSSARYP